jgi:hypothetical protein
MRRSPSTIQRYSETTTKDDQRFRRWFPTVRGEIMWRDEGPRIGMGRGRLVVASYEETPGSGARLHGPSRRYCQASSSPRVGEILPRAGCAWPARSLLPRSAGLRATSSHRNVHPMKVEPAYGVQAGGEPLGVVPQRAWDLHAPVMGSGGRLWPGSIARRCRGSLARSARDSVSGVRRAIGLESRRSGRVEREPRAFE